MPSGRSSALTKGRSSRISLMSSVIALTSGLEPLTPSLRVAPPDVLAARRRRATLAPTPAQGRFRGDSVGGAWDTDRRRLANHMPAERRRVTRLRPAPVADQLRELL